MTNRFFVESYPTTQGITCMELICRGLMYCCVKFDQTHKKPSENDIVPENEDEEEEPAAPAEQKDNGSAPKF